MVRFGVGLVVIIFIFSAFEHQLANVTTFKHEESWIVTGLKTQDITNFYQNFNCQNTQRTFLACVNSLSGMASYIDLKLTWSLSKGLQLVVQKVKSSQTEKEQLSSWLRLFKQSRHISMDFLGVWTQLAAKIDTHRYSSYIVGVGINDYLSVSRDPHSYILPKEYYEKVVANSQPRVSSYGFALGKADSDIVFARIYPESLFDKLGVAKGDVLLEVDGSSVKNSTVEAVSDLLRRKDRHIFKVKLQNKVVMTWTLSKQDQVLPSVSFKRLPRGDNRILHLISVYKISEGVCRSVETNLKQAIAEKTNGIILDLRDNSGGSMDEVLCLSGLFVGDKKIYDLVYFNKKFRTETFYSEHTSKYSGPLVVLVNRSTASSAEILAGVIQHYGRGTLVGERTFGKGSFQEGEEWSKNSKMLYFQTKGTFHLPSGRSPQLMGIQPDIEVADSITSTAKREEDLYLYPIGNRELREKSSKRIAADRQCRAGGKDVLTADRLLGKALGHIDCIQL